MKTAVVEKWKTNERVEWSWHICGSWFSEFFIQMWSGERGNMWRMDDRRLANFWSHQRAASQWMDTHRQAREYAINDFSSRAGRQQTSFRRKYEMAGEFEPGSSPLTSSGAYSCFKTIFCQILLPSTCSRGNPLLQKWKHLSLQKHWGEKVRRNFCFAIVSRIPDSVCTHIIWNFYFFV